MPFNSLAVRSKAALRRMLNKNTFNPFYAGLVVVGILFAITACAYGVMMVRLLDPRMADEGGLVGWMNRYGLSLLVGELIALAALTMAAIASDDYFTRRAEQRRKE